MQKSCKRKNERLRLPPACHVYSSSDLLHIDPPDKLPIPQRKMDFRRYEPPQLLPLSDHDERHVLGHKQLHFLDYPPGPCDGAITLVADNSNNAPVKDMRFLYQLLYMPNKDAQGTMFTIKASTFLDIEAWRERAPAMPEPERWERSQLLPLDDHDDRYVFGDKRLYFQDIPPTPCRGGIKLWGDNSYFTTDRGKRYVYQLLYMPNKEAQGIVLFVGVGAFLPPQQSGQ